MAFEAQLSLNVVAVGLADGGAAQLFCRWSRWPGWSSLKWRAGLIRRRVRTLTVELLLVGPYRVARNACGTLNLALGGPRLKQGPNGGLQMQFQDVHSCYPLEGEGVKVTSCQWPPNYRCAELSTSIYGDRGGAV
jgi:hypothetical protein